MFFENYILNLTPGEGRVIPNFLKFHQEEKIESKLNAKHLMLPRAIKLVLTNNWTILIIQVASWPARLSYNINSTLNSFQLDNQELNLQVVTVTLLHYLIWQIWLLLIHCNTWVNTKKLIFDLIENGLFIKWFLNVHNFVNSKNNIHKIIYNRYLIMAFTCQLLYLHFCFLEAQQEA